MSQFSSLQVQGNLAAGCISISPASEPGKLHHGLFLFLSKLTVADGWLKCSLQKFFMKSFIFFLYWYSFVGVSKSRKRSDFALFCGFKMNQVCSRSEDDQSVLPILPPYLQLTVSQVNCARYVLIPAFVYFVFMSSRLLCLLSICSQCVHNLQLFCSVVVWFQCFSHDIFEIW